MISHKADNRSYHMRPYSPQDRNLLKSFPFEIDCNIQQHIDAMITLTRGSGVLQNTTLIQ